MARIHPWNRTPHVRAEGQPSAGVQNPYTPNEDLSWYFDWVYSEDPQTYWDDRYEARRAIYKRYYSRKDKQ